MRTAMRRSLAWPVAAACALLALWAGPGRAADPTPEQTKRFSRLVGEVKTENLRRHIEALSAFPSRVTGTEGCDQAAQYILKYWRSLGLEDIHVESFPIAAPLAEPQDPNQPNGPRVESYLQIVGTGQRIPLYPLWPNSVRTSMLPRGGIELPLINGGKAELTDFNGKVIDGAAVLMDFDTGSRWLRAPRLGARAVIFAEPQNPVIRGEAESKYLSVPMDTPRFYVKRGDAQRLLAMLQMSPSVPVRLNCRQRWDNGPRDRPRQGQNLLAKITGTDPKLRRQVVFISAYYDSISVVPELAPGAESTCGLAAMLELARILKAHPPGRTVVFLATSGHFESLTGIRSYFGKHLPEMERGVPHAQPAKFLGFLPYTHNWRERDKIHLFATLDLSSQTRKIGIFFKGYYYEYREDLQRRFSDLARVCREDAEKIGKSVGWDKDEIFADGVNPIAGKPWRTFIPGKIAFESETFTLGGGMGVAFATTDDTRAYVDTPYDLPETVDFKNLTDQVAFLACLFSEITHDPKMPVDEAPKFARMTLNGGFAVLTGRVVTFDPRKGVTPNEPKKDSLVTVRPGAWEGVTVGRVAKYAFMGVRGDMAQVVDDKGRFVFYGVPTTNAFGARRPIFVDAYHTDPATGTIDFAPDLGVNGNKAFSIQLFMTMGERSCTVVVFRCAPIAIFDIVDPQSLQTLPGIHVYDGQLNAEPREYGYAVSRPEQWVSYVEDVALVFGEPGSRLKITMELGPAARRFLLLDASKAAPEGRGIVAKPGTMVSHTALRVAQDMWYLDDWRINKLAKYRIINENLDSLHKRAGAYIVQARKALERRDYSAYDAAAWAAWGYEARAYPEVQGTTDDVVWGSLFYLVLMLPFAAFLERLLFAFPNLKSQIAGTVAIFAVVFTVFRFIHPAFDITLNPLIILESFIMLALSVMVIALVAMKFENQLRALQTKISGIHRADIGRMSVAAAAFALGISNMRRRRARTVLTCVTLILLTFTVLSFTSVVSGTRFNDRPSPGRPRYQGLLLRQATWAPLEESAYRLMRDQYFPKRTVVGRAWFYTSLADEQSFIRLTSSTSEKSYNIRIALGMAPGEVRVTKPQTALSAGRWFQPGEEFACIVPTAVATTLNLSPADVGKAKIQFAGMQMTLVGIMDSRKFRNITDLDNEPLTPVDFIQMQKLQRAGEQTGEQGFQEYIHMSPDDTVIIPYTLALNMGAKLQSVAIDLVHRDEVIATLKDLMPRLGFNLYAGLGDTIRRWSAIGATRLTGLTDLLIPILIAALIVLNTMLGSVYERVREISIFSSVGLAPNHIAMLFMAESFVYSVLGAIFGYLIGQGITKVLVLTDRLQGLYLNYSSLSAVFSTLIVIGVVLLSTVYPARKASEVATPAVERRWHIPEPVGDLWEIALPFAVTGQQATALNAFMSEWFTAYEEYSIGDFVTQDVETKEIETPLGKGYVIDLMTWLAPFDLGVSQHAELKTTPTEMADVYELRITLTRQSGDVSSWKRVNRRFLNTLRKQFLIWRTLRAEDRERYLTGAQAQATDGGAPQAQPSV